MAPSQEETDLQLNRLDGKKNYVRFRRHFDQVLKKKDLEVCNTTPENREVGKGEALQVVAAMGMTALFPIYEKKTEIRTDQIRGYMNCIDALQHTVFASRYARHRKPTHCHSITLDQFQHWGQVHADTWVT